MWNNIDNCSLLAAALSANYLNTEIYNSTTSSGVDNSDGGGINAYLMSHGTLFSMCLDAQTGGSCIVPPTESHISASWFNAESGAASHFFPTTQNIGMILDPSSVRLKCVYPANAGTDLRDKDGCGPRNDDRKYSSNGYDRMNETMREYQRQYWKHFQDLNYFGASWEDIPCDQFFQFPTGISQAISFRRNETMSTSCHDFKRSFEKEGNFFTESVAENVLYNLEPFFGGDTTKYPPCNKKKTTLTLSSRHCPSSFPTYAPWWLYTGDCVWDADMEWQEMVDAFLALKKRQHHHDGYDNKESTTLLWNEVVLETPPRRLEDMILAIFFVVDGPSDVNHMATEQRKRARLEAKLKGNKPVLIMNVSADATGAVPLFECDEADQFVAYN